MAHATPWSAQLVPVACRGRGSGATSAYSQHSLAQASAAPDLVSKSKSKQLRLRPSQRMFAHAAHPVSLQGLARRAHRAEFTCTATSTSPPETPVPARRRFPTLRGNDIRHPLDKQNTAVLSSLPGVDLVTKGLLAPVAEEVMYLENIGTSVRVSDKQMPGLHNLMQEAADVLGIQAPDLYVRQSPQPNAYTLAINGKKPFVVVHTSLVELLTPAELQAVLAHELGHLKCDHGVWLSLANVIAASALQVPGLGVLLYRNIETALMRWVRAAELTCDRAALLVAQDPKVVCSVMMKLAGGSPSLASELSVDAFLEQARSYDDATTSGLGWYLRNAQSSQLSHPLPVLRAKEIDRWAQSDEYMQLLARGTPLP